MSGGSRPGGPVEPWSRQGSWSISAGPLKELRRYLLKVGPGLFHSWAPCSLRPTHFWKLRAEPIYKETQGALVLPLGSQERQVDDNNWHSQSFQATPCSVDFTWFNSFNSATTIRWAAIMIYVLKQGKRRSWEVEWLTHSRTTSKHQYWDLTPGTLVPEPGLGSTMLYATPAS